MGESVVDVLTTCVSEKHGYVIVRRGIYFLSSDKVAAPNMVERVRMAHINTKMMPRIRPTWCRGMRWSPREPDWESNSKRVDEMTRLWRLKLEAKETRTPIKKATGRTA